MSESGGSIIRKAEDHDAKRPYSTRRYSLTAIICGQTGMTRRWPSSAARKGQLLQGSSNSKRCSFSGKSLSSVCQSLTVQSMASPPASRWRFGKPSAEPSTEPSSFKKPWRSFSVRIDTRAHCDCPGMGMQKRGNLPRGVQGGAKGGQQSVHASDRSRFR